MNARPTFLTSAARRGMVMAGPGKDKAPESLAARMPSAQVAAKVGMVGITSARRIVRRRLIG